MIRRLMLSLLLVATAPVYAHPLHFDLAVGVAHATRRTNGTWWQQGFPFRLGLNRPSVKLGVGWDATRHVSLDADALWFGEDHSSAAAVPDANYNATSATHCNGPCLPLAHFHGQGWAAGAALTVGWHTIGPWQFGVHGGPIEYREHWTMSVPDWYPNHQNADGAWTIGPVQPININREAWHLGYTVGASVQHGPWVLSVDWYKDGGDITRAGGDHFFPPIWRWHTVVSVGVSI